ncbi:Golgi CORVET complex core vacuolar protein 8-domain-containing protein [Naematelia encephala]|uniref:Golgi CORVET complex core vacuolar protein 8-domain-containing protein n=1 Tax=Naematelia encephala TaxID=71784 RepID=A0A1Y2B3W1_9TREE|nr:Golgi CORVET complex core vacuolar protein 8-domain-containing protein [Naematelia encephala]
MSTSQPHPNRQASTNSNITVRADSRSGRRRRSSASNQPPSLFARLTGRSHGREEEDDDCDSDASVAHIDDESPTPPSRDTLTAGPSDYWQRSRPVSPDGFITSPPALWRELSVQPAPQNLEMGPYDEYRPKTSDSEEASEDGSHQATKEDIDREEYDKRLQEVLNDTRSIHRGREGLEGDDRDEGAGAEGISPSHFNANGMGLAYENSYLDNRGEKGEGIGEEEFGVLQSPQRDDASDRTPSTVSISTSAGHRGSPAVTPSLLKRETYLHPSVSRLRSHLRTSSASTQHSIPDRPTPFHARTPSHFSQISMSRSDSVSTTSGHRPALPELPIVPKEGQARQDPAFVFHPLRHLSAHLFSRKQNGSMSPLRQTQSRKIGSSLGFRGQNGDDEPGGGWGQPTVLDVRGVIAVGTDKGWTIVYGFGQEVRHVLGTDSIVKSSGAVSCITISMDQTYVAVGHTSGNIHLYDLASPGKPARTTMALSLPQILSGQREGHLQGSRIIQIGFVGSRHTSIVSGDEFGRAFWWSLGKVIGVESNDVVRMLGSYPEANNSIPNGAPPSNTPDRGRLASRKPTTLFATLPLPIGVRPHPIDKLNIAALLTPVKLVIVAMKPQAKTWFRKMRGSLGGDYGGFVGSAAWLLAGEVDADAEPISDPVLAYSWGTSVSFLRIRVKSPLPASSVDGKTAGDVPEFLDGRKWEAPNHIRAMSWYDPNHLLLMSSLEIILLDVRSMLTVETTPLQTRLLTAQESHSGLSEKRVPIDAVPKSILGSVRTHRGKLFLLTKSNVQVGTLQHWNDRILACVHRGDFLSAIHVALAYYENRGPGNTISLPSDEQERKRVIGTRIRELMSASLDWAFSEDRMHDDTHYSVDGRGVDLTGLFEGLATICVDACLSMGDTAFLFDDAYQRYAQVGIQGIFLGVLEPYIFEERIREISPNITQALIALHDARGEYDLAEAVIWHVDPMWLDINQAVRLCEAHALWDALIHVYTRAMRDYVAPIVKLLAIVRNIQRSRANRDTIMSNGKDPNPESRAQDAYKLFAYIENILSGITYPTGAKLSESNATYAKSEVYGFLFSGRSMVWPEGSDGEIVLAGNSDQIDDEVAYPYLDLLLRFDTEAFLHAMDIAFEDSYLNDQHSVSRQSIVNLMLDIMDPVSFPSGDITFLHIFVARNLPKYRQFLFIPPSTLHRVLVSLASDPDQSTREDRQLAAEYLLSAYTPHDHQAMFRLFEAAGFWRILRGAYGRSGEHGLLISTLMKDPELDEEVFECVDHAISTATSKTGVSTEVSKAIVEAIPHLLELSVRQTAVLLDKRLPSLHDKAIDALKQSEHKQMAYLRCLLEPTLGDIDETSASPNPSAHLNMAARQRYVALLTTYDRSHVITFLDKRGGAFFDLPCLAAQFEESSLYEGYLWALDRQGKIRETFETAGKLLLAKGSDLGEGMVHNDEGTLHLSLQAIRDVSSMAVRLCREHTANRDAGVEDMWFGVLNEVVDLVHTLSPLASAETIDQQVIESLRLLVQETLSSLVSSTSSSSLSFPRLFKRLVDASNTTTQAKKGRAYSEFRTILTGMLDSYRAEGEMLEMTTRLVEADLFVSVAEVTAKRQRGWRPSDTLCDLCGKYLWKLDSREEGGEGKLKILGSGMVVHLTCEEA